MGFRAAVLYLLTPTVLLPFYQRLSHTGDVLVYVGTLSVGALMWLATLLLFLLLRALFGGVPATMAPQDRRHAFTSSGRKIAAYILASLYALIIFSVFNERVLLGFYSALRVNGQTDLGVPIIRIVLITAAVVFFLIFGALRRAILKADEFARAADQSRGGGRTAFGQAIAICFGKYAAFSGRAGRPEFWFWVLFQTLLTIGLTIVDLFVFGVPDGIFSVFASLTLLLPGVAVTVRRLHDIDFSGWWLLLLAVPFAGIAPIIMICLRGTAGANRFGPGSTA